MAGIAGYRQLNEVQIETINQLKMKEKEILNLIDEIRADSFLSPGERWLALAKTHIEIGFMAAVKSIANPT